MRTKIALAAVMAVGTLAATAGSAQALDGCGPGGHRGYYGYCRPNLGPRPFYGPRVGFYGPRWGGYRWGGYRGVGWHRGWHHGGWHHRW